jgi:hypothetical protein
VLGLMLQVQVQVQVLGRSASHSYSMKDFLLDDDLAMMLELARDLQTLNPFH